MWLIELMMLVGNKHKRRTSNFVADNLISWEHTTAVWNLNILVDDSMISRALKLAKEDWDSQSYCKHRYQHMKNEHTCDYLESEAVQSWTRRIASWILRQPSTTYHSRWLFRITSRSHFSFAPVKQWSCLLLDCSTGCLDAMTSHNILAQVTIEDHPHLLAGKHASVHPCKHAAVMKKIVDVLMSRGVEPEVDK